MKFHQTPLKGAYTVEIAKRGDDRGFFARVFCENEFTQAGLIPKFVQVNNSLSAKKGTLRGMHYQAAPHEEIKIVRCTAGAIVDVIVDLRTTSPTYAKWVAVELTAANRRLLYVPQGFAHGFQTLCDATEIFYQISTGYEPGAARGIRWDDPALAIRWPDPHTPIMSERDRSYPDFHLRDGNGLDLQRTSKT